MSKLSDKNYVFTTKIELDDNDFIVIREPTSLEIKDLGEDNNKNMDLLKKILPNCIVESSFEDDDGNPAKGSAIVKMLESSGSMYFEVLQDWQADIPFGKRRKGKLGK